MEKVIITELPKEGHIRAYKVSLDSDVLGTLRVFKDQFIWVRDLFAAKKIGRKTAINYFKNYNHESSN